MEREPKVAWVTCRVLPEPDPDQDPTCAALQGAGLEVRLLAWDDPAGDPANFSLCLLRSCWNYYERPAAFLEWVDRAAEVSRLVNPASVVHWNLHKLYLRKLRDAGIPIIPTVWLERGEQADLAAAMAREGWDDVVIKPAISAASFGTRRFKMRDVRQGQAYLEQLLGQRDVMVQRYMRAVDGEGEHALVWIDGELTHVVRKSPRFADGVERVSDALSPTCEQRRIAERAMDLIEGDLLYARIDVMPDDQGGLVVSELELMEPSLFLMQSAPAMARFVEATRRRAVGDGP